MCGLPLMNKWKAPDRKFKLTFHREKRELAIYALTIAKNGVKLRASTPDPSPEGVPPLVVALSPMEAG